VGTGHINEINVLLVTSQNVGGHFIMQSSRQGRAFSKNGYSLVELPSGQQHILQEGIFPKGLSKYHFESF
jgi:hypothetical protein